MWFTSDNASGAPAEVMDALGRANEGWASAYGADDPTSRACDAIRDVFEAPEAAVYFVSVGTAANALALGCLTRPWEAVFCHRTAHIEEDEGGAPEFFTDGAKLTLAGGADGMMDIAGLTRALTEAGDSIHNVKCGALSITQTTEVGTNYPIETVTALTTLARDNGMGVHMDGTRLANALAATGLSPAEMTWKAGVDILCLGGTKNGALAAEAVILFDKAKAWEFERRRKRGGHLFSKMRFMSAQFEALMTDDLWLRLAAHSNGRAARLAEGLRQMPDIRILHPVDANLIFAEIPVALHEAMMARGAAYYAMPIFGRPDHLRIRLVSSFQTTDEDVDALLAAFRQGC
ncbi:MAG: low specificity L-threonine aldolase [Pseudomonadota bacterium]